MQGIFGEAFDRMQVAKQCGNDLGCYGKMLSDPSWPRAEVLANAPDPADGGFRVPPTA